MGEIVNYMQIDTGRLEYVAGSIHTVWDGIFQVRLLIVLDCIIVMLRRLDCWVHQSVVAFPRASCLRGHFCDACHYPL